MNCDTSSAASPPYCYKCGEGHFARGCNKSGKVYVERNLYMLFCKNFQACLSRAKAHMPKCAQARCKLNINWSHHPDYLVQKLSSPFIQDNHIIFERVPVAG